MDDWFRVDVTRSDEGAYLALVGELDAAVAPELAARIEALAAEQSPRESAFDGDGEPGLEDSGSTGGDTADGGPRGRVVIDLSRLTFIDSTGAEVIRAADERSIEVMSAGHPCREVRRVFEVVGLDHLVDGS